MANAEFGTRQQLHLHQTRARRTRCGGQPISHRHRVLQHQVLGFRLEPDGAGVQDVDRCRFRAQGKMLTQQNIGRATQLIPARRQISTTGVPSAPCVKMNAFCASESLLAFIVFRASRPGDFGAENSSFKRSSFRGSNQDRITDGEIGELP